MKAQNKNSVSTTIGWAFRRGLGLLLTALGCLIGPATASAQDCAPPFQLTPVRENGVIDWKKFPEFTLPFTIIYSGPRFGDSERLPLRHGFSHLGTFAGNDGSALPPRQRALIWYGLAYGTNQPWSGIESPFNNDLAVFRAKWRGELQGYANQFDDSRGRTVPNVDILLPDIERDIATERGILNLKTNPLIPPAYQRLPDSDFVRRYQRDMQKLYAEPLKFLREEGLPASSRLGTYGDAPIRLTNFLNVDGNTWPDWSTNPDRLNYLLRDTVTNAVGGPFHEQMNLFAPSAYYCNDYPNSLAGNYLAYLLFQVEANCARTAKDIVVFEWLRFRDECGGTGPRWIRPWMAEASAIFPFFSGAKGIWLWDNPGEFSAKDNYATYEQFIYGLYRLSRFADFFSGDFRLLIPKTARDHFADRDAVWRAVVKGNRILVAAHNPFADDGRMTNLPVQFGAWQTTLTLKGTEVFLCAFDLPGGTPGGELSVFPNPATGTTNVRYASSFPIQATLQLTDLLGRDVYQQTLRSASADALTLPLDLKGLTAGVYFLKLVDGGAVFSRKLVIQ